METKKCNKCGEIKNINEFAICKRNTGGRQYQCKQCKVRQSRDSSYKFQKEYNIQNKDKQKVYVREWYNKHKHDPIIKLSRHVRYSIWAAIRLEKNKSLTYLGCSWEELKQHIESQFIEGMNWNNYGSVWEIDHIKGICNFDLSKLEEQHKCFHYTNLQPLFKTTKIAEQHGSNVIGNRNKRKK